MNRGIEVIFSNILTSILLSRKNCTNDGGSLAATPLSVDMMGAI
jgi:hypothetical protein